MISDSRKSDPGAREGPESDRAGGARICAGCGQPVKEDDLAVAFARGDVIVPGAAYCLVRILPLLYGHGRDGAELIR